MTPSNTKFSKHRGGNLVQANPKRLGQPSDVPGARWATGRNVKLPLPHRRWGVVEVWALKERGADGKVVTVAEHRSREAAEAFVKGGTP